jgi:choline dehydrogenase-like flavoprotein
VIYHPVGTSARHGHGQVILVVDEQLRVRGVQGLRVAGRVGDAGHHPRHTPGTIDGHGESADLP